MKASHLLFAGLVPVVLASLKLAGVISWGWWWITAPLWLPLVIAAVCLALPFVALFGIGLLTNLIARCQR